MNTSTNPKWEFYKELELLPDSIPAPQVSYPGFPSRIRNLWQFLGKHLIQDNREPQIWQSIDGRGTSWWYAYNPLTEQTICFGSEDEVRIWLDQYPY